VSWRRYSSDGRRQILFYRVRTYAGIYGCRTRIKMIQYCSSRFLNVVAKEARFIQIIYIWAISCMPLQNSKRKVKVDSVH
jgi:hypothetical protein